MRLDLRQARLDLFLTGTMIDKILIEFLFGVLVLQIEIQSIPFGASVLLIKRGVGVTIMSGSLRA